jgi:hypothetical protein
MARPIGLSLPAQHEAVQLQAGKLCAPLALLPSPPVSQVSDPGAMHLRLHSDEILYSVRCSQACADKTKHPQASLAASECLFCRTSAKADFLHCPTHPATLCGARVITCRGAGSRATLR